MLSRDVVPAEEAQLLLFHFSSKGCTKLPQNMSAHPVPYNGYILLRIGVTFTVLECVFVALRFVSKRVGRIAFGTDDWLIVFALANCLGFNALGLGKCDICNYVWHKF